MAFDFFIETKNRGMIPPRKHCFLVEGTDDAVFMDQLLKISNHDPTLVCVMETDGRDNLARFLQVFSKIPEFTSGNIASIVVMFDADDAPGKAEQLVHNAYDQIGMEKPKPGEFLNKTIPGTGLYLSPGNGKTGNLENIFIEMPRDKDDIRCEAAEEVIKRIIDSGVDLDKLNKRKMQTVLAVSTPDLAAGIGRGLRNGALELDIRQLKELREFIDSISKT